MSIGMEGCGPNPRTYSKAEYDALHAENARLREQVKALQSDANGWQSGYDKGREDGAKSAEGWKAQHARDSAELRRLCAERDSLQAECERLRGNLWLKESVEESLSAIIETLRAELAELAAIKAQEPVAILRYSRNAAGLENEMPLVISCNDLADGEHRVYALPAVNPQLTTEPATAS